MSRAPRHVVAAALVAIACAPALAADAQPPADPAKPSTAVRVGGSPADAEFRDANEKAHAKYREATAQCRAKAPAGRAPCVRAAKADLKAAQRAAKSAHDAAEKRP